MIKFQLPDSFRAALSALGIVAGAMLATQVYAADALVSNDRAVFAESVKKAAFQSVTPAATVAAIDQAESMEFMIALKMRNYRELTARIAVGAILTPAEMAARYYPLESDYLKVVDWLKAEGFTITKTDPARLGVFARGTVAQLKTSLQVDFTRVDSAGKTYTSAATAPSLPVTIAPAVLGINGLQPEIQPRRHSRRITSGFQTQTSNAPPFYPREILKAYNADTLTASGAGQKIGIVIDTFPLDSDLTSFWSQAGVTNSLGNIEKVQVVSGPLSGPSGEETLDVEWASGIAPGAKVRIYASLDLSFVHVDQVFQQIVNDLPTQAGMKQISISLGLGETFLSSSQIQTDSQYMAAIAAGGVTICVSSGDSGSNEGGVLQASYFASDPNVAGIGGTSLSLNSSTGAVSSETVWSGSGGGISTIFNRPGWQVGTGVPAGSKRLVPDVSAVADPGTGGFVVLNGSVWQFGGTSWSAPVWAGFCARINQGRAAASMSPLGVLGPRVYPLIGTSSFRDITSGSNGAYSATAGYDLCTGIGVPHMGNLYNALSAPVTQPNLQPAQPIGWSDAIVVSKTIGTNTDDLLTPVDTLYVDFGFTNSGGVPTSGTFSTELYVDNVLKGTFQTTSPLAVSAFSTVTDISIGRLALGTHTIRIKVDAGNSVAEVSEADNEYTKTITITPPLLFDSYAGAAVTNTGSTPRSTMGMPITLGSLAGTANIPVSNGTAYLRATTTTNYTNIRLNITFWGAASGATSGTALAFSNSLGTYTFDFGSLNATAGGVYPYTFTLPSIVVFPSQTAGVTVNWQGDTGSGLVSTDNLTSAIRYGGLPAVGALTLGPAGENGYYRNASSDPLPNFYGSSYRSLGLSNQGLALQLYAPSPVAGPPAIVTQPVSVAAGTGGNVSFSFYATSDPAPTYQWQRQPTGTTGFSNLASNSIPGVTIGGINASTLSLTGVLLGMSGDQFRCVVTNSSGSSTTNAATLTVNAYPVITQQPAGATVAAGQPVTLTAAATASGAVTYQWRRNGLPITGATGATLTLGTTHVSDSGSYNVIATANGLDTLSSPATLAVTPSRYPGAMYLDPTFAPSIEASGGIVHAMAVQANGRVLIGSERMRINGAPLRYLERLNADGSVDTSFNPGLGPNGTVRAIVLQADGKILIGGDFTSYDGTTRGRIARLNADGSLDFAFDTTTGANNSVYAIAVAPDGSIQVGGYFSAVNGATRSYLARLSASSGGVLASFDPGSGPNSPVNAMAFQSDGKLIITGYFSTYAGVSRTNIARVNANGSLDTSFNRPASPTNDESIYTVTVQPDGKIIVGGYSSTVSYRLGRLNTDGSLDSAFNTGSGPSSTVTSLAVQPDGKILAGGWFGSFNGTYSSSIVRLNANGSVDTGFVPETYDLYGPAYALALTADGKITMGGAFYAGNLPGPCIRRLATTGSRDTAFTVDTRVPGNVYEMLQQADGKLLIAGSFNYVNGIARNGVARLLVTGTLDTSFNPGTGFDGTVTAMVLQPDGKLVAQGGFYSYNSNTRYQVARVNADGSLDATFDPGFNYYYPTGLASQADGKFLIGGSFTTYNGTPRNYIARINSNGTFDPTFDPGAGPNDYPRGFTLQPDGRMLFRGYFSSYNNTTRNGLARILPDGALDASFAPATGTSYALSLLLQPDGKVVVSSFNGLTRLLANGSVDSGFVAPTTFAIGTVRQSLTNPRAQTTGGSLKDGSSSQEFSKMVGGAGLVGTMYFQPDGKLLLGQLIDSGSNLPPPGIARLTANGALDSTFSVGGIMDAKVTRFIMLDDGQLLAAGGLFTDGLVNQFGVARLTHVVTPTITTQPAAQSVITGGSVTFTVAGTGGGLQYQWYRNGNLISGETRAKLVLTNVTAANAGQYTVTLTNGAGTITSNAATLTVLVPPTILGQPSNRSVGAGGIATFTVTAGSSATPLTYQWRKGGVNIPGATSSQLSFSAVAVSDAGTYDVVVSNTDGPTTSTAAILTVLPNPGSFSSRQMIGPAGATSYFALEGNQTKHLLLRAVGPTLTTFGVSGVLADPQISLLDANGTVVASNDNWGTVTGVDLSAIFAQVGAFPLGAGSKDAALYATLPPGSYQVKVSGVGATTGIALLELYDTDTNSATRLAYVGMRGKLDVSTNGLSSALAIKNSANKRMLIRAIGPTLGDANALPDPQLQIFDGASVFASNDNWGNVGALITAASQAGAFPLPASSLDAAILVDQRIGTGAYGATVPYFGTNGDALVEIYDINAAGVPTFAPLVVIPPVGASVQPGNPVTLRAFAVGGGTLSYQWRKNGTNIAGATSSTFNLTSPLGADSGSYDVKVSSSFGNATSSAATVVVNKLTPTISWSTPAAITYGTLLSSTQLNASASFGGNSLPGVFVYSPAAATKLNAGANPQTLSVTFTPTDSANYAEATGTTTILVNKSSQTITFDAIPPRAANSGNAMLGATSDSGLAVTYTASNPSSGTVATVSGSTVTPVNAGTITITANQAGDSNYFAATPVSQVFTVTAPPPSAPSGGGGGGGGGGGLVFLPVLAPTISTQPASQQATAGSTVTFRVVADGSGLFFQWFKDGGSLGSERASTLTLTDVKMSDAGSYHVVVSNTGGSVTSSTATLTVAAPPTIGTQPASQSVAFGANVVLSVTASGVAPFTYQWRKDGSSIAGATAATLSLTGVTSSAAGAYSVVVTNAAGSVTSNAAVLAVSPRAITGSYFGTLGNNEGNFALYVRGDRTGVFLGYLNAGRNALISRDVVIDTNGRFSVTQAGEISLAPQSAGTPPLAAAGASYRIEGTISPDGVLTGNVPELNLAFNAPTPASAGATSGSAGFYQSGAAGSSATSYAIVGPAGDAFFVTVMGATADAGKGTVSAGGALNITTAANAVVTGSVQAATTMLSATVTPATGAATTFVGINNDTRTDIEKLINISTRSQTGTAVNTLIAGFVISGDQRKPVLVRAIGPTLGSAFGVGGALSAARLELFRGQTSIAVGADWGAQANATAIAGAAARVGAFALAANSHDASLLIDLEPGAYTAVVTGQGGASGVSLVEVYDATSGSIPRDQRIINIATRATAGTGDNSLIAGFVISGSVPKRVLIRGVGPTLASFGLTGVLARPQLSVSSGATVLAQNAGWSTSPDAAAIAAGSAQVGAFALGAASLDAALIVYLAPGAYTAQVSGAGNTTGVALIEVYELP